MIYIYKGYCIHFFLDVLVWGLWAHFEKLDYLVMEHVLPFRLFEVGADVIGEFLSECHFFYYVS